MSCLIHTPPGRSVQEIHLYFRQNFCHDAWMNSDNPQDMAKTYLDAWQQQWSQLAADPAWQQMAQQQFQQFAAGMMSASPPGMMQTTAPSANVKPDETRPHSSQPASELGAQLLAECFMRMARLEARVADLESRLPG